MKYNTLNIKGAILTKNQLENYLEKAASDHILQNNSKKETYPVENLKKDFYFIREVYDLLNEHIKLKIPIHPAGEWLLDNFYLIDETVKTIIKNLTIKKYKKFLGISNGIYEGYARIYVLASEIIAYSDNKIDIESLSDLINAYQKNKNLSMEEIWNIGIFMQIALVTNIKNICEKIYFSQMQKYKVENIIERLVENKKETKFKNISEYKSKVRGYGEMKYPFIEYMSYRLKKYGKRAYAYINILEEQVNKMGTTIEEVINKEHYDIAIKKVSMANSIKSMKELLNIDFLSIFEKINGVEEVLKKDPANVYCYMDNKTKEYYRNQIQEISKKARVSEFYVASKALKLAQNAENIKQEKEKHIGYYLIDKGKKDLEKELQIKIYKSTREKIWEYMIINYGISIFLDFAILSIILKNTSSIIKLIMFVILFIPIEEIINQIFQYILSKTVKPKLIPKMNMNDGVPKEYATFVVIPTIIKDNQKVKELMNKLEIYYLANKSENIYFALLGDCSSGKNQNEEFDSEVIQEGIKQCDKMNQKYNIKGFPKFHFLYRNRTWNQGENSYLGWERKRGLLNQFNEYLLKNEKDTFKVNTIEMFKKKMQNEIIDEFTDESNNIPNIKYIITLDSDTELTLNTGLELIGAMSHILNKPMLNKNGDRVIDGHAIMQPRIGINMEAARKSIFTKIFAGNGGTDSYTNAISDVYQDNFQEGIFTGKGIYDLKIFSKVLKDEIPENTVLSHDLLEGCYLRCGLVSDIVLMDGYPQSYNSFKTRLHRWIRGDFQIVKWMKKNILNKNGNIKSNPLNFLSKYKIFDNLIKEINPITILFAIIFLIILSNLTIINITPIVAILIISLLIPTILDIINRIIFKKDGQKEVKSFEPTISSLKGSILRGIMAISTLPDKAYLSLNAILKTIYRMNISKKNLLEWTTSEEADKNSKTDLKSYYANMLPNIVLGILGIIYIVLLNKNGEIYYNYGINIFIVIISIIWLIAPLFVWYISKLEKEINAIDKLSIKDKEYVLNIGKKTWEYFKQNITEENNFLPPDNYQEDRTPQLAKHTSPTNIGLALLAVISSYDLGFENLIDTLNLLKNMLNTIEILQKWNGHLYNWYNIKDLKPLIPRYISTVDSGNFIGYVYVLKQFYIEIKKQIKEISNKKEYEEIVYKNLLDNDEKENLIENINLEEEKQKLLDLLPEWTDKTLQEINIARADFSKLYNENKRIFSIGFNVEENKLTDSYYDLLASEARQASIIAIAKKDVPSKHWYNLSRTLTTLNGYRGLVSWSGTAFEYLMPNINIRKYKNSLLDESCKFMIMCQKEYARKLGVPWGFSETTFNVKDFSQNYQYKAIGIPWIGLKRGLEDDIVVTPYGSIMAITDFPNDVVNNLKILEKQNMYGKFGFYESIDYTPVRLKKGKKYEVIKTYMAHHQGLILLSINNLFNKNVLVNRFSKNPEIGAVEILLQEKMPESFIITKEQKEKPLKIKYIDYEDYAQRIINKINEKINRVNVIANNEYVIVMDQKGNGYSKYKNIYINRYKETSDEVQGIAFYIKNIKNKRLWSSNYRYDLGKPDKYEVIFTEDSNKISRIDGNIQTIMQTTIASEKTLEIRKIELKNSGSEIEKIEITSVLEPIISNCMQDYAHPAFNNLFLRYEYLEEYNTIIVNRKDRKDEEKQIYLAVNLYGNSNVIGEMEFEIDKEKLYGRGNVGIPDMIKYSKPFSKKINFITDPIIAIKKTVCLEPGDSTVLNLIISIGESKEKVIENLNSYLNMKKCENAFELSKARVQAEIRYLGLKAIETESYQQLLGYLLYINPMKKLEQAKYENLDKKYPQSQLWKYGISGDIPIMLLKIKNINDIYVLEDMLKAYEFYRSKNIEIDFVIINEELNNYENYVKEAIMNSVLNRNLGYMLNRKSGIFILKSDEDIETIEFYAHIVLEAKNGLIRRQLKDLEEEYIENYNESGYENSGIIIAEEENLQKELNMDDYKYCNEYGGFSNDGKEYHIRVNKDNRLPTVWSHILANENFGTLVTESGGGFTWSKNSRLNRLTSWSNNQVVDNPSEIIYLQDKETLKTWSMCLNPMPDNNDYYITYGFGYANFMHTSSDLMQSLTIFVPQNKNIKINLISLKNLLPRKRKIKLVYYVKPVLGEDEIKTDSFINLKYDTSSNSIFCNNLVDDVFLENVYITSSEKIKSFTGSKKFFVGKGNLSNPEALKKINLNYENSLGQNTIIAIQIEIELEAFEGKEISITLGAENEILMCKDKAYRFSKISNCQEELEKTKRYWIDQVEKLQIKTPMESFNILLNGWLIYQILVSRLWGKTAFYQSGGAYGFRDQLQDTIGLKYMDVNIMKNQILKHSRHQFLDGDVEHWWHDETSKGIRTRFSDDFLWLVYVTCEYIKTTGDKSILDIGTSYIEGKRLEENEDERYDKYIKSDIEETIYEHCIKAIDRALNFGDNGLPKIGSGDWNDGFSTVGNKGKGESVWLGFFLYDILERFIPICIERKDEENAEKYKIVKEKLKKNLNAKAWDGRWYRRAYMDDGTPLGSLENDECKIDSISQSWSIISNAGDNDKKFIAMESLENHLIDRENGIIKLLDPPFEKGKQNPGYIKSYLPGVRENGGQYTHEYFSCGQFLANMLEI